MLKFLKKTAKTTFDKIANIAVGFLTVTVSTLLVIKFYNWLFAVEKTNNPWFQINQFFVTYKHPFLIEFFLSCIIAPLIEEVLFRHFPLRLIKATKKEELIIPTILFTSVVFGLMHQGSVSIPLQGFAGLVMSIVYLKNGYSYWSSVALHAMWNTALLLGILNL